MPGDASSDVFHAFAVRIGMEGFPKTERTLEFVAQRLATFSRMQAVASGPGWIDEDPADWDFPTWRVTARPYDWRFDGGVSSPPIGVAMHGARAGELVTIDLATGVPWLAGGDRADASVFVDAVAWQRGYVMPGAYTGEHVEVYDGRGGTIGVDDVLRPW